MPAKIAVIRITYGGDSPNNPIPTTLIILDSIWFFTANEWWASPPGTIPGSTAKVRRWGATPKPGRFMTITCSPGGTELDDATDPLDPTKRGLGQITTSEAGCMAKGTISWKCIAVREVENFDEITDIEIEAEG